MRRGRDPGVGPKKVESRFSFSVSRNFSVVSARDSIISWSFWGYFVLFGVVFVYSCPPWGYGSVRTLRSVRADLLLSFLCRSPGHPDCLLRSCSMKYLFPLPINRIPQIPNWSPPPTRTTVIIPGDSDNSTILPGWFSSSFFTVLLFIFIF